MESIAAGVAERVFYRVCENGGTGPRAAGRVSVVWTVPKRKEQQVKVMRRGQQAVVDEPSRVGGCGWATLAVTRPSRILI